VIEVRDLYFTYPNGVEALKGISLRIRDGEFVAIMGQNGAGKTTLIKHFNGLLKPTKGQVVVDELDITKVSVASISRNVGFVFQNPDHQLFSESVEEEISFALRNFGFKEDVIKDRVTWALNLLGLTQYRQTSPFMLSGGERKRVALASILAWDPKILILDEPTIGQDYQQKEKLRQFILQMKTQEKTIIIVTHDVEFVAECNPRVLLMLEGKIIADGESERILTDTDILNAASIVPPQIAQIFLELSRQLPNVEFPKMIIDLYDAREVLLKILEKR
jgi:energy-coupling factor transport system ATP-binding protein